MSIFKEHLSYTDFVGNEIKTLGFIQGLTQINQSFNDLANKSQILFHQYSGRKNSDIAFQFKCDLNMLVEKQDKTIFIEALLRPNFSEAVYVLSICDQSLIPPKIMRKFHFDFAPVVDKNDRKPVYHLQYGGKPTPRMKELNVDDEHILPWLSSPRINSTPINLALLLDMIFCEFPSEPTYKIIGTKEWRDLIKNNEDLVTKLYYKNIAKFFTSTHKSDFLFRDFYYGKK